MSQRANTPRTSAMPGVGALIVLSAWAIGTAAESRVIHFPPDRSLGELYVRDADPLIFTYESVLGWKRLGEAKGEVQVPRTGGAI